MENTISRAAAWDLLWATKGRFFTVGFYRRNDSKDGLHKAGDIRVMNCRTGVTKDLAGGPPAYDPNEHDLFWVYDIQAKTANKRRSINMRGLAWIKFQGITYRVY